MSQPSESQKKKTSTSGKFLTQAQAVVISSVVAGMSALVVAVVTTLGTLWSRSDAIDSLKRRTEELVTLREKLSVPVGSITAFGGEITTEIRKSLLALGWLPCDGKEYPSKEYQELWERVGVNWGNGNRATTFNVPDLRGVFLRGLDDGAKMDPDVATRVANMKGGNAGNKVGSIQMDAVQDHDHQLTGLKLAYLFPNSINELAVIAYKIGGNGKPEERTYSGLIDNQIGPPTRSSFSSEGSRVTQTSVETRPKNAAVNWLIRAKP